HLTSATTALSAFPTRRSSDLAQFCIDEIFQPKHAELSLSLRTKLLETSMKKWISALAIAASALPLSAASAADSYPDHAITWIVRSEEHTSELQSRENLVCRRL